MHRIEMNDKNRNIDKSISHNICHHQQYIFSDFCAKLLFRTSKYYLTNFVGTMDSKETDFINISAHFMNQMKILRFDNNLYSLFLMQLIFLHKFYRLTALCLHVKAGSFKTILEICLFFKLLSRLWSICGQIFFAVYFRVSVQGVESLWGDYRFIPADWGSQQQICAILLFLKTFHYKND